MKRMLVEIKSTPGGRKGPTGSASWSSVYLLVCGIGASALYVAIDLLAAVAHPTYHSFSSMMVSELMAKGAPTEALVDPFGILGPADLLHIGVTVVLIGLIFLAVLAGASLLGERFKWFSYSTAVVMLVFGALTSIAAQGVAAGEPTPWVGITERVNIGAFLLWVAVLSIGLWPRERDDGRDRAQLWPAGGQHDPQGASSE